MKERFYYILAIITICFVVNGAEKNTLKAYIFIDLFQCYNCENSKIKVDIDYFQSKDIKPILVVKNCRPVQIKKARKLINDNYKCAAVFDTNEYYTKKLKPGPKTIVIADNDLTALKKMNKYTEYETTGKQKEQGNDNELIDVIPLNFEDNFPLDYYHDYFDSKRNVLIFDDRLEKILLYIDFPSGKLKKIISYKEKLEYIKKNTDTTEYQLINRNNINRSISLAFITGAKETDLMLMLLDEVDIDENRIKPHYAYFRYNPTKNTLTRISEQNRFVIQTKNMIEINSDIYLGIYDGNYHHSRHYEIRDSSIVLAKIDDRKFVPVFYLSQFEKLSGTIYSYSFLPELIDCRDNKSLIVFNPLNSLLFSFNTKTGSDVVNYKVGGRLKQLFEKMKKFDKFGLYEHRVMFEGNNIYSSSQLYKNGFLYILLIEKPHKVFLQIYDRNGNFISENLLGFFTKDDDILKSVKLINISENSFDFLVDWKKSYMQFYRIDKDYFLKSIKYEKSKR